MNIIERIIANTISKPESIACIDKGEKITYQQIYEYAVAIQQELQKQGICEGHIVAVYMERSWKCICSILGILMTKAAFLPIDINNSIRYVKKILDCAGSKLVIVEKMGQEELSPCIFWEDIIRNRCSCNYKPTETYKGDRLAYVIFTSGTSGVPKGAMIEYVGMCNHIEEKIRILEMTSNDNVAFNASIGFDISVW